MDLKNNISNTSKSLDKTLCNKKLDISQEIIKKELMECLHQSPLKESYELLQVESPIELYIAYMQEDQKLMALGGIDYENPDIIVNQIKYMVENVNINTLTIDEKYYSNTILWMWYHHATSYALFRKQDKEQALRFVIQALKYQPEDMPNQITMLLFLLANDQLEDAQIWTKKMNGTTERETAELLINDFKTLYL